MIENEDSVVTSLNELRKLKNERISRQSQSRPTSAGNRAVALVADPLADQLTPLPGADASAVATRAPSAFDQKAAFAPATMFDSAPAVHVAPVIQTRTSYKAAFLVTVVLGAAGAVGYTKLQQDSQAALAAKDAALKSAEDTHMRSIEAAVKTEQVAKANLRQCEDKLKASLAAASPAPVAPAAAAVVAPSVGEKKPHKASRGSHRASARLSRQVAQAAVPAARERETKEKGGDVPTIARKKKVDNDPLAGLGKL